ncbi:MAG: hypothetical protein ABIA04_08095 [Pseudomonadota bacterium]
MSFFNLNKHKNNKRKVITSIALKEARRNLHEKVIASLLPQINGLNLYLNGFDDIPACIKKLNACLNYDKDRLLFEGEIQVNKYKTVLLRVATSKEHGDLKDNGKFFFIKFDQEKWNNDYYHFTCDDDIVYPKNYVKEMLKGIVRYDNKAAIGVHGSIFLSDKFDGYYSEKRQVRHFTQSYKKDRSVHILGTGTLAYYADTFKSIDFACFNKKQAMSDIWLSIYAKRNNIKLISIKRKKDNWLKPLNHKDEALFDLNKKIEDYINNVFSKHFPWEL